MATRKPRRSEWRERNGKWTCSLGERGMRVRLFQKRKGGPFYRAVWIAGHGRDQKPLQTRDRDEALRLGRQLLAALLQEDSTREQSRPLTLGGLWRRFEAESAEFLDNTPKTRADTAGRAKLLMAHFGKDLPVAELTADRQRQYEQRRQRGGIVLPDGSVTRPVRARSVEADVVVLHAMLRWATTVRGVGAGYLLDRNPLQGVRRVREKNKKQPVATWERYVATREAMRLAASEARNAAEKLRWTRMEFALFLAEATGRRLGAIRQLRWEDFRFTSNTVIWRAEADKKGYQSEVPMPADFMEGARRFQKLLGAIAGSVFSAVARSRDGFMDRHQFDRWLVEAERRAGLPKLDGSTWHAYRRKWVTERKHLPVKDVAAAGGWKEVSTVLDVYQHADQASVLAAMSESKKLREAGVA
ncbi:MAG: tyrosine-type recombinase/integrase [Gemmatimonadaceae bacterium]